MCLCVSLNCETWIRVSQGCISCGTCSYLELTEDHVLTTARNAVNESVWRKKNCFWLPLNKHAMNIWLSSLRIRAHLSWRTGRHLHVFPVLRTYSTCSIPDGRMEQIMQPCIRWRDDNKNDNISFVGWFDDSKNDNISYIRWCDDNKKATPIRAREQIGQQLGQKPTAGNSFWRDCK